MRWSILVTWILRRTSIRQCSHDWCMLTLAWYLGCDTKERIPMITLLPSPYVVLTLAFTYPLCSDIFHSTRQFYLHRAVYIWWIHQQQCQDQGKCLLVLQLITWSCWVSLLRSFRIDYIYPTWWGVLAKVPKKPHLSILRWLPPGWHSQSPLQDHYC